MGYLRKHVELTVATVYESSHPLHCGISCVFMSHDMHLNGHSACTTTSRNARLVSVWHSGGQILPSPRPGKITKHGRQGPHDRNVWKHFRTKIQTRRLNSNRTQRISFTEYTNEASLFALFYCYVPHISYVITRVIVLTAVLVH